VSVDPPVESPTQTRTLAQQLGGAFALFGALVAAAFLCTALMYGVSLAWLNPETEQAQSAARAEGAANAAMLDEENGLRAYLLTGDAQFIEPYARAKSALAEANTALAASANATPELARMMLDTRLAEEKWHEQWANAAANANGSARPSMLEGKALFDVYRSREATLAAALRWRSEALANRGQHWVTGRVVLELAVFTAILLLALRQHRALRNSIVVPVSSLLQHIKRVRDGELDTTASRAGPRELAELAEGLNEMVGALTLARQAAATRDDTLRDHSIRLRQILDASREFSESLNLAYVVGAVRASTAAVGGYERVIVWLMDDERKELIDADERATSGSTPIEVGKGLAGRAAKSGRMTFENEAGQVRFGDSATSPIRAIAIPLIVGARVVGALEARHVEARVATTQTVEILEMLATHAATAIESARLHEVIEERSQVDPLTKLFNRRRLEEDLDAECKRCLRYERPLAFVMLDVDNFKAFNDSHGHPQADTALQDLAEVMLSCVRTTDTAYRYGGEEFCIVLRETSGDDAVHFAERMRKRIEQRFASGAAAGITASFGVAEFSASSPMPRSLVEAADAAMYDSKHSGRNRVMLSANPRSLSS
jgi:diguanylate cyclase (GGDEF)-like protein